MSALGEKLLNELKTLNQQGLLQSEGLARIEAALRAAGREALDDARATVRMSRGLRDPFGYLEKYLEQTRAEKYGVRSTDA